jgi:hypothetical protein
MKVKNKYARSIEIVPRAIFRLMNSRGGPPILRGGPLGTISMDHTVLTRKPNISSKYFYFFYSHPTGYSEVVQARKLDHEKLALK